jgi:uncharacterized protein (DUF302 family)
MLHIVDTAKDVPAAARDLEAAVARHKFGVLHVHDLRQKMQEKGVDFPRACRVLEVCNPHQASRVLAQNMAVSVALPCRIAIYEEGGRTKLATMLPTAMLALFPGAASLQEVAADVEREILAMMDEAK